MIIFILLILLSKNKYYSSFSTRDYLSLLLILFIANGNYNINSNFNMINRPYLSKSLTTNKNYNCHRSNTTNKTISHPNNYKANKENHSCNMTPCTYNNNYCNLNDDYINEQCYDYTTNPKNYNQDTTTPSLIDTNKSIKSVDTISSENSLQEKPIQKNTLSKKQTITNHNKSIHSPKDKATTIHSILNKNLIKNNPLSITPLKDKTSYSLECITTPEINTSLIIDKILIGNSVTIAIESFGLISGKLLSIYKDVISLRLNDNRTLFINKKFISFLY